MYLVLKKDTLKVIYNIVFQNNMRWTLVDNHRLTAHTTGSAKCMTTHIFTWFSNKIEEN